MNHDDIVTHVSTWPMNFFWPIRPTCRARGGGPGSVLSGMSRAAGRDQRGMNLVFGSWSSWPGVVFGAERKASTLADRG